MKNNGIKCLTSNFRSNFIIASTNKGYDNRVEIIPTMAINVKGIFPVKTPINHLINPRIENQSKKTKGFFIN